MAAFPAPQVGQGRVSLEGRDKASTGVARTRNIV